MMKYMHICSQSLRKNGDGSRHLEEGREEFRQAAELQHDDKTREIKNEKVASREIC